MATKKYKVVMRKGKAPKPSMTKPKTLHSKFAAKVKATRSKT